MGWSGHKTPHERTGWRISYAPAQINNITGAAGIQAQSNPGITLRKAFQRPMDQFADETFARANLDLPGLQLAIVFHLMPK